MLWTAVQPILCIEVAARYVLLRLKRRFHIANGKLEASNLETRIAQQDLRHLRHVQRVLVVLVQFGLEQRNQNAERSRNDAEVRDAAHLGQAHVDDELEAARRHGDPGQHLADQLDDAVQQRRAIRPGRVDKQCGRHGDEHFQGAHQRHGELEAHCANVRLPGVVAVVLRPLGRVLDLLQDQNELGERPIQLAQNGVDQFGAERLVCRQHLADEMLEVGGRAGGCNHAQEAGVRAILRTAA